MLTSDMETSGILLSPEDNGSADSTIVEIPVNSFSANGRFKTLNIDDKYIKRICQRYRYKGISNEELIELAIEGVYRAVSRYDKAKSNGASFKTYATNWIRERILQRFKDLKRHNAYIEAVKIVRPIEKREYHPAHFEDSPDEYRNSIADKIPHNLGDLYLSHIRDVASGVLPPALPTNAMLSRMLTSSPPPFNESDLVVRGELETILRATVSPLLTEQHFTVFMLRFGVNPCTYKACAEHMNCSTEVVRTLFFEAVKRVKTMLSSPLTRRMALQSYEKAMAQAYQPILESPKNNIVDR